MFIDGGCENLIVVNDGGELPRNIKQKKKSEFYSSHRSHYLTDVADESLVLQ